MLRGLIAVLVWCAAARPARADDGYLARLAAAVRTRLDEAAAAHVIKLVPPVPVVIKWKPQRLGSIDLGAPIAAVAAADLDGDGRAELYLVTSREVIAVGVAGRAIRTLGRVAFAGDPAVPASRDVVGSAVVDGHAVVAAASAWAKDLRVGWSRGALTAQPGPGGFPMCNDRLALVTGRNHFHTTRAVFGVRCRDDLTDDTGAPLHIRAELATTGALEVTVDRCAAGHRDCRRFGAYQYRNVGVAFEIADANRDGTPELIASSAGAPGERDAVRVIALGSPAGAPVFEKSFAGGVAGIAVADGDGDGVPEVLAVVRLAGSTRVDVWRLD